MSKTRVTPAMRQALLKWYENSKRALPWRANHDPYRIWISEVMLQQTTVAAVIPYYTRFTERFPDLKSLAQAEIPDVLELWSGLGYYSRARNLHKAAITLQSLGNFPHSHVELLKIAGFGPYTARAVSSIAFNEPVGVVDGNVIRVLSRVHDSDDEWWKPAIRQKYQNRADEWVQGLDARDMNQALMELGATVCTPKNPACLTCPLFSFCEARKHQTIQLRPRPKPRRAMEVWIWDVQLEKLDDHLVLIKNEYAPFLKGQWIWPGQVKKSTRPPSSFDYSHTVTHHKIYVRVTLASTESKRPRTTEHLLVNEQEVKRKIPTALLLKALPFMKKRDQVRSQVQE